MKQITTSLGANANIICRFGLYSDFEFTAVFPVAPLNGRTAEQNSSRIKIPPLVLSIFK